MAFPNGIYTPPGTYSQTNFESPVQGLAASVRIPLLLGTGSEVLVRNSLELVRGSSASVDQRVPQEDETGRAVVSISQAGAVTLGAFDGVRDRIQLKNYPIVTGDGTGTTVTNSSSIAVTINGEPIVVLSVVGATGIIRLSVAPELGDEVLVTYFFNRTDTLITDTLSDQVTADAPEIYGAIGETYDITLGVNDTFLVTVDDTTDLTITFPAGTGWTAAQMAAFINAGVGSTSLSASAETNAYGATVVLLTADSDVEIGAGTSNTTLGFTSGDTSSRNKVFYTFQSPIVDGSNGGVTTTDPADVTVKVDGVQVIPTAVDGASGAVTLAVAPAVGAVVTCQYYFNSWQDTFDYLEHKNVTNVTLCGLTPDRSDYAEGSDFVLEGGDRIMWGTAVAVDSGVHTSGSTYLGESQVSTSLVDARQYLALCTAYVDSSVSPAVESRKKFTMPLQPTTGNGRDTPLGATTYSQVANGRLDLPSNRPDLVHAYWGFSLADAIERGRVTVTQVDSATSTLTLASAVPVGASVYATFYYNTITDNEYSLIVDTAGASGVGTYTVEDQDGNVLLTPKFGTKSVALTGITVEFPSGSESEPDCRFETPFTTTDFVGAVEEDVTVTFKITDGTIGTWAPYFPSPFYFIDGFSDRMRLTIDGSAMGVGAAGINLGRLTGQEGLGFHANLVGSRIPYESTNNYVDYTVDATNNQIDVTLDGEQITATVTAGTRTLADYVTALNAAALLVPPVYHGTSRVASNIVISSGNYDVLSFHYTGDTNGLSGGLNATVAAGTYSSATTLAAAIQTAVNNALSTILVSAFAATVAVSANSNGEIEFALTKDATDGDAFLEFLGTASGTQARNKITVNVASLTAGDVIQIGALAPLTGVAIARTPGANDFRIDGTGGAGTAAAIASEIAAAINDVANAYAATYTATVVDAGSLVISRIATGINLDVLTSTVVPTTDLTIASPTFFGGSAGSASDLAILLGLDTAAAANSTQVKLVDGVVARRFTVAGDNTSALLSDRIILRNRLVPGSGSLDPAASEDQATLLIGGGSGNTFCGLETTQLAHGAVRATVASATMRGIVGLAGGQVVAATYGDARDGQPLVTFYADGGTEDQNNVFKITLDGTPITVTFTDAAGVAIASGASAEVPLGPATSANTILNQIAAAVALAGFGANAAAVISAGIVRQEGLGIRIRSTLYTALSSIVIGNGSANDVLGFSEGDAATRTAVEADVLASALMSENGNTAATDNDQFLNWATPSSWNGGDVFAAQAVAYTVTDETGAVFVTLEGAPTSSAGLGTASSIVIAAATAANVYLPGSGFEVSVGDGGTGEDGVSGFYVTSSDPANGSGTANTSVLNTAVTGEGQDGMVGQTYRDLVTGLTFTILDRAGGSDYPTGSSFTFTVRRVVTTDSNLPISTIPGVEVTVSNTSGVTIGDSAVVSTFEKGGEQPAVGDVYYISYEYTKSDFVSALYTKMSSIVAAYGANSTENPVTLAAYLAILNGASLVAIRQIAKDTDADEDGVSESASLSAFIEAIDDVEGVLPGGAYPDILIPLKGDSLELFQYLAKSCDIQSSIRYRAERTAICGVSAGTGIKSVGNTAQAVGRSRLRLVYPDTYRLSLSNSTGKVEQFLVDGPYMAAAVAGTRVAPSIDVATPWTNGRVVGFDSVARTLDGVQQNQVAVRGVTVIEQSSSIIRIRQGLTTDMTDILTKLPTVTTIADEVQKQSRSALDRFIGKKFVAGITSQIEGQLSNTMKQLKAAQIVAAYQGIRAATSDDDPTTAEVEAWYQPVFPLLYIVITFNLRASL